MKLPSIFLILYFLWYFPLNTKSQISEFTQGKTPKNPQTEKIHDSLNRVSNRQFTMGVDTQFALIIGYSTIPLSKAQPESNLGNFLADAQLSAAKKIDNKVVASVINYGGIRQDYIPPGPISKGLIHEIMPFNNKLIIVEVPGDVLKIFCDHIAKNKGWPISGITFTIFKNQAIDILIDGQPLNENLIYKIALSDYLAEGGNNCHFLKPLNKTFTKILVRNTIIDYIVEIQNQHQPIHPLNEKRIIHAE